MNTGSLKTTKNKPKIEKLYLPFYILYLKKVDFSFVLQYEFNWIFLF